MRQTLLLGVVTLSVVLALASCGSEDNPSSVPAQTEKVVVVFETSLGDFAVALYPLKAPITVANCLRYIDEKFYDGLTIHRVVKGFVVQGGAYYADLQEKPAHEPIPNEAENGLSNLRGTIGMARLPDPHSATSQFFINVRDNQMLDFREKTSQGWGYCAFGEVVDGMDVVDAIENVQTTRRDGFMDVPAEPVVILKVYRRDSTQK